MAVAAMAIIGSIWTTEAQDVRVLRGSALAGFIHGQMMRVGVAHLIEQEEGIQPVCSQAYIYDATSRLLVQSAEVDLPLGARLIFPGSPQERLPSLTGTRSPSASNSTRS